MSATSSDPRLTSVWKAQVLHGYLRADGRKGIRNLVVVMAAADNTNPLAQRLAAEVPGVVCLPAGFGRGQLGEDLELTLRTMANLAEHPNVFFTLVVSFEAASSLRIVERISDARRKDTAWLSLLDEGGLTATLHKAIPLLQTKCAEASQQSHVSIMPEELILGLECGGSDTSSGVTANPCLGLVSDALIRAGGTATFSEPVECTGCDDILLPRARTPEVAAEIRRVVRLYDDIAFGQGVSLTGINPTADNIQGGLSSIEEKALGAIAKSGSMPIEGVLAYGERPTGTGLWFMDAPAAAAENLTALAAGGCQVIVFTTGSCNPVGHPIAPTVKICANPSTVPRMREHLDADLSSFFTAGESLHILAEYLIKLLGKIINGEPTTAEQTGFLQHTVSRIGRSV